MADVLDLGGGEAAEAEATFAADSAAVTIALERTRRRRGGGAEADRFLAAQEALIADQRRHLHEQLKAWGPKLWSERLRVTLQVLTLAVGVLVVLGVSWMAWAASRADGIVIKPFSVPPALAQRGVTGEAVAAEFLDQLGEISDQARSISAPPKVAAEWGENISIEIPETGVSLSQLDQWLRAKLGHERRLTGEVSLDPDGRLMLKARLGARSLPPQAGDAWALPDMIKRSAEALYRREQPKAFAQYLTWQGRDAENEVLGREMARSRDASLRAWGHAVLGVLHMGRRDDQLAAVEFRRALAENAGLSWLSVNLASIENRAGRMEATYQLDRQGRALTDRDPDFSPDARRNARLGYEMSLGWALHDHASGLQKAVARAEGPGFGSIPAADRLDVAANLAATHEVSRGEAQAVAFDPASPNEVLARTSVLADMAALRQDWAADLALLEAYRAGLPQGRRDYPRLLASRARVLAHLGRTDEAEALLAPTPGDCSYCDIVRGEVADAVGRTAEADGWYRLAGRLTPSLPDAPLAWGKALLERGQAAAAVAQFALAARRSPRAEEAQEGLGEALMAGGDAKAAIEKLKAADALTPKWGRLHLKWGEALLRLGKRDEARARFNAAAAMDLTAAERTELAGVWHG